MSVIHLPRRWQSQPQNVNVAADDGIYFAIANSAGLINDRGEQTDLRGYWDATTRAGGFFAVTPNTNTKTLDVGAPVGDLYGGVLHFNLSNAAINSATSGYFFVSDAADAITSGSGLAMGSITGYLTDETITFANTSTGGRTGIATPLELGVHTLVFQWVGDRYELWLDGMFPPQMQASGGPSARKVMKPYLGGRSGSTRPFMEWMLAGLSYDPSIDMREYVNAPYAFLRPRSQKIYVSGSGATFDVVPSGATVQSITSTGATPKCTITRTGSSPAGTLYYVIYPDGDGTPSDAQIIAGQDSTGSAATASGNEACRTTTGDQIFASPATGCAASTAYRIAFVASDGVTPSAVAVSASAFTTLAAGYETSVVPASVALTGGTISSAATANASTAVSAAAVAITGAAISSSATAHQAATVSPAAVALTGAAITSTASASQSSVVTPAVVALSGAGIQSQPTAHVATAVSPAGVTLASQVLGSDVSTATGAVVSPAVVAITGQAVASQVTQSDAVTAAAVVVTPAAIGSVVTAGVKTVVSPASVAVSGQLLGSDVFEHAVTQVTPASIVVAGALITSAYSGGPDPGPRGPASLNIAIRRASYRRFGKTWHAGGYWRLGWPSVRD